MEKEDFRWKNGHFLYICELCIYGFDQPCSKSCISIRTPRRCYADWWGNIVNNLTQLWTLCALTLSSPTIYAHWCSSDISVLGVTNCFFKNWISGLINGSEHMYCNHDQKPMYGKVTGSGGGISYCCFLNDIWPNYLLTYIHRPVLLSALGKINLFFFSGWLLMQWLIYGQSVKNKWHFYSSIKDIFLFVLIFQ